MNLNTGESALVFFILASAEFRDRFALCSLKQNQAADSCLLRVIIIAPEGAFFRSVIGKNFPIRIKLEASVVVGTKEWPLSRCAGVVGIAAARKVGPVSVHGIGDHFALRLAFLVGPGSLNHRYKGMAEHMAYFGRMGGF